MHVLGGQWCSIMMGGAGAVTMEYGAPSGQQGNVAGRRIVAPDRNVVRENT